MAVVTTGFFDGVHLGHRKVIDTLLLEARRRGEESVIVTFWPHPRLVLGKDADNLHLLTGREERDALLLSLGVDRVETLEFTKELSTVKAEDYVRDILVGRFGASTLVVGYDNTIGSDRLGAAQLGSLCEKLGVGMVTVEALGDISSTKIRKAVGEGLVDQASQMLGRKVH